MQVSLTKRVIAARVLTGEGILLLVVAAIHLLIVPSVRDVFRQVLSTADFTFAWPAFLLNHVVVGILLIPIGLTTLYCASGVKAGEQWAWSVGLTNAMAILALPFVLVSVMERRYFSATPFLIASILITAVGISMVWPLVWVRKELTK